MLLEKYMRLRHFLLLIKEKTPIDLITSPSKDYMVSDSTNMYNAIEKILVCDTFKAIGCVLGIIKSNAMHMPSLSTTMPNYIEFMYEASEYLMENHNFSFIQIYSAISYIKSNNWHTDSSKISPYVEKVIGTLLDHREKIKSYSSGSTPQQSIDFFISYATNYLLEKLLEGFLEIINKVI